MIVAISIVLVLAFSIIGLLEVGRCLGKRRTSEEAECARGGISALDGAVFALMGLLIAFTFSGAAARLDSRRHLIVEEVNDIGTAWKRLDLLQPEAREALRDAFRRYLDARIASYKKLPDFQAAKLELDRASAIGDEIWSRAVAASQAQGSVDATKLLVPALNAMLDIATTRTAAAELHPPFSIFVMLLALLLVSSLLAGYEMAGAASRKWTHALSYAFIMSMAVYMIADLEFPRLGLIRIDRADHFMVELRESMK